MKSNSHHQVILLMAEDDDDDFFISLDAMKEVGLDKCVKRVKDGDELIQYLMHKPPFESIDSYPDPDVIFLDLNMPKKDGREALKEIKSNDQLRKIPIVILTTSNAPDDISTTYKDGANSYIQKPDSYDQFINLFNSVQQYWLKTVKLPSC